MVTQMLGYVWNNMAHLIRIARLSEQFPTEYAPKRIIKRIWRVGVFTCEFSERKRLSQSSNFVVDIIPVLHLFQNLNVINDEKLGDILIFLIPWGQYPLKPCLPATNLTIAYLKRTLFIHLIHLHIASFIQKQF